MNIITWRSAHCLFPTATLEASRGLRFRPTEDQELHGHPSPETVAAIQKYTQRGYRLLPRVEGEDASLYMPDLPRRVDDSYSWTIALDLKGIDLEGVYRNNWDPILVSVFCSKWSVEDGVVLEYVTNTSTELMKYKHVLTDDDLVLHFTDLCNELGKVEYKKPFAQEPGQGDPSIYRTL